MKAFRCQLPKSNAFYADEPPKQDVLVPGTAPGAVPTCEMCGLRGSSKCSRCGSVRYCGRDHQAMHWRRGHSTECTAPGEAPQSTASKKRSKRKGAMTAVFKEWAVYVDSEMSPEERAAVAKAADQAVLKKYAAGTKGKKGQCVVGSVDTAVSHQQVLHAQTRAAASKTCPLKT